MMALIIENDGSKIVKSNYWDSEFAQKGYFFCSFNAGAAMLLIPDSRLNEVPEMATGKLIILSRGTWNRKKDALEILFDDGSDEPHLMHLSKDQLDRLIPSSDNGRDLTFSAWKRGPVKLFERPAKFRIVKNLPCLEKWKL
jgi:hypothetical protein